MKVKESYELVKDMKEIVKEETKGNNIEIENAKIIKRRITKVMKEICWIMKDRDQYKKCSRNRQQKRSGIGLENETQDNANGDKYQKIEGRK